MKLVVLLCYPNAVRMASNDLKTWVSDKLMVLLGYSQTAVVNYLIAMGNLMFQFWIMELMKLFW